MSRADFLKTVTATCDWPIEYVAIQAAADLEGDMRTLLIEHMRAQWRSIDQAAIDTGAKR